MTVPDEVGAEESTIGRSAEDGGADASRDRSAPGGDRASVTVYRWTCPICGASRTGMASGNEDPLVKAEFSLRQHVVTTDDDGHGRANAYPPGFDPDAVDRMVSVG